MNTEDRRIFIQKNWKRYPTVPDKSKVYGTLYEISFSNNKILLKINDQFFEINVSTQKNEDYKYLSKYDIVAIDVDDQIVLLSPCLAGSLVNADIQSYERWNSFLKEVRIFFEKNNFLELQTPSLVVNPGTEPCLEVFQTELRQGSIRKKLFLPTSPELSIKKLIAYLVRENPNIKVFEIAKVFRNDEFTDRHLPEFFMLEWYRPFQKLDSIKKDIVALVQCLSGNLHHEIECRSMKDLFKEHVDFDLVPETSFQELKGLAQKLQIDIRNINQFDDLFNLIFLEKIEFKWPKDKLFFLEKYPPSQAALARVDGDGWADRFEFYWQGFEIANAFHELNDPILQRERMKSDIALKKNYGKSDIPFDEDFIKSLEFGFPPTSGVALGLDRMFMALNGLSNINDIRPFWASFLLSHS